MGLAKPPPAVYLVPVGEVPHKDAPVNFLRLSLLASITVFTVDVSADAEPHWAFVPPKRPVPPQVSASTWPRITIDRFVLKRIEDAGEHPSPEADWTALVRRLHLDLTGLSPTLAEIAAFESDYKIDPDTAYTKRVDRLLASPHFGEKWARWWMDLSHYGDSDGYLTDQLRPCLLYTSDAADE